MALIQALVIVAAMAAVAAALLLRADAARQRVQTWFIADQAALYLDAGVAQVRAMLDTVPDGAPIHTGQAWARDRDDVRIDRGVLAWRIDDLHGRFNVNGLAGQNAEAERAAFLALARAMDVPRGVAQRLADVLGPDPRARARAAAPAEAPDLPLLHPRQLAPLAHGAPEAFAALLEHLSALPPGAALNVNTVHPEVLAAYLPRLGRAEREALARARDDAPFETTEAFLDWAADMFAPDALRVLERLALDVTSETFEVTLAARLDTIRLRRSVVLSRNGAQGRSAVLFSVPEPD
ncbi:MAG: hypothetical protein Kow0013_17610 [Pararhodobacter sp.]